jgi:hypothetical protein
MQFAVYPFATRMGLQVFQLFWANFTFWRAVERVNGGDMDAIVGWSGEVEYYSGW